MSDRDPSPWLSMKHVRKGFINVNHNWFHGFIYDRVCISLDNYFPRNVCRVYRCKFSFWQSPWPRSGPPGAPAVSPVGWGDRPELVNQTETLTLSWRANTRFRMSRNATKTLVQMVNCPKTRAPMLLICHLQCSKVMILVSNTKPLKGSVWSIASQTNCLIYFPHHFFKQ